MTQPAAQDRGRGGLAAAAIWRGAWFLGLWLVLAGADISDLPAALVAVFAATWASLHGLPPGGSRVSVLGVTLLALRFLGESVVAGLDVARRALDPRLPLRPGLITYSVSLPPGAARNVFTSLTSLLPGTVPAADEGGQLVYHCLDVELPVVSQLAGEEEALMRAINDAGGRR